VTLVRRRRRTQYLATAMTTTTITVAITESPTTDANTGLIRGDAAVIGSTRDITIILSRVSLEIQLTYYHRRSKGCIVFRSVCLCVCLDVCQHNNSCTEISPRIFMSWPYMAEERTSSKLAIYG